VRRFGRAEDIPRQRLGQSVAMAVVQGLVVGPRAPAEGFGQSLYAFRYGQIADGQFAQGGIEVTEEAVDEVLGGLIGRARQVPQTAQHEDDMQRNRLEASLDGIRHTKIHIKTRGAGSGGDALIERLDDLTARVRPEQSAEHHSRRPVPALSKPQAGGTPRPPAGAKLQAPDLTFRKYRMSRRFSPTLVRLAFAASLGLAAGACTIGEEFQRGYLLDERAVQQVKTGMNAEQVLQTLGTPSTVSTVGNKNWYYISQTSRRRVAFMGESVTDQRVTAVYFDRNFKVERVALYGVQDGKLFDFISRTTPSSGSDQSFVGQMFKGLGSWKPF
jgi:outer membrane protein assembly factor BamE (lipoprotein component of BamABCDE complex)